MGQTESRDFHLTIFNPTGEMISTFHLEFNCKTIVKSVNKINAEDSQAHFTLKYYQNSTQMMDIIFDPGFEIGMKDTDIVVHCDFSEPPGLKVVKLTEIHSGPTYTFNSNQIQQLNKKYFANP